MRTLPSLHVWTTNVLIRPILSACIIGGYFTVHCWLLYGKLIRKGSGRLREIPRLTGVVTWQTYYYVSDIIDAKHELGRIAGSPTPPPQSPVLLQMTVPKRSLCCSSSLFFIWWIHT